jgi:ribonuclease R
LWCHRELARTPKEVKQERAENVVEVCDLISANEIKNQKIERMSLKVCSSWLLRERVGEVFQGTISGIEQWGVFVAISDPMAEGLVRFRDLPGNDFFIYNPDQNVLFGRRSGLSFKRGDTVEVQLLKVNPLRGENDFAIIRKLGGSRDERAPGRSSSGNRPKPDRAEMAEQMGLVEQPRRRGRSEKDEGYDWKSGAKAGQKSKAKRRR